MKRIYDQPCQYHVDKRIEMIKNHLEQGLSFHEIGDLFGVGEGAIKYQWGRYFLKTWKPKIKKVRRKDVYEEFKSHYNEVMEH